MQHRFLTTRALVLAFTMSSACATTGPRPLAVRPAIPDLLPGNPCAQGFYLLGDRPPTCGEAQLARDFFGDAVRPERVTLNTGQPARADGTVSAAFKGGRICFFGNEHVSTDYSTASPELRAQFIARLAEMRGIQKQHAAHPTAFH